MVVKTVSKKGGVLIDTDTEYSGFVADDTSGLHFVSDADNTENQKAISTVSHRVTESNNPLWNQVNYTITDDINYTSSGLSGHVTLIGIDQMGIEKDIMQHRYSVDDTQTDKLKTFDLLQSACTSAVTKQIAGSAAAGAVEVDLAKRYDKYESVTLKPVWYDSNWTYRQPMQLTKSEGYLHGVPGHEHDYYGVNVGIIYDAHMNDDLSDLRFVAPDGITICPHYFTRNITTKVAGSVCGAAVVMIPWQFVDYESEAIPSQTIITDPVNSYPSYLYMYYGNANATTTSDPTLGGQAYLQDDFNQLSLDPQWTLHQSDPARNTIAYATTGVTMGATAGGAAGPADVSILAPIGVRTDGDSWECIIKLVNMTALTQPQGLIFRFQGHADPTSYVDIRVTQTTPYNMGNGATAAYVWGMPYSDSGVGNTTGTWYRPAVAITSAKPIYVKFKMNIADANHAQTYNVMSGYLSANGYDWDYLGKVKYMGTVWDTPDDLDLKMWYYVSTGVTPVAGNIKIEKIITYPIMGGKGNVVEDSFQDIYGASTSLPFLNRWATQYNNTYRTISQSGGALTLATTGTTVDTAHTIALENGYMDPLCVNTSGSSADDLFATGDRQFYGPSIYEDIVYETEISSMTAPTTASDFTEAGIYYYPNGSFTGNYGFMHGLRRTQAGVYRIYKTTWTSSGGGTVSSGSTGISWTTGDLPIKLRIRFNHRTQKVIGEYRKMGTGGEWLTAWIDSGGMTNTNYLGSSIGVVGMYIRGSQTIAEARSIAFNYFNTYSGNRILADRGLDWRAEETYSAGVAPTTPVDEDMKLTFASAGLGQRNEPYQIVTKDYGGDYSYSKIFNLRDQDYIQVGPDGVDKYIGMKLEFNFDFESTDIFKVSEINYIYEVI